MPGMMRNRKSGCSCPDCDRPRMADRASEKRTWQREEWQQACAPTPTPADLYELARDIEDDPPFQIDFGIWAQLHQEGVPTLEEAIAWSRSSDW